MISLKLPLPLRKSSPHVTHCSSGQGHLSSQTASRSVQPFFCGSQMLYCIMHCQWGRKPSKSENCHFPLAFRHRAGGGPSYGHRQRSQKLVKMSRVVPEICSRNDIHTHPQTYSSQYSTTAATGKVIFRLFKFFGRFRVFIQNFRLDAIVLLASWLIKYWLSSWCFIMLLIHLFFCRNLQIWGGCMLFFPLLIPDLNIWDLKSGKFGFLPQWILA